MTSAPVASSSSHPAPDHAAGTVRYWEVRRIPYNLVLAVITVGWVVLTWPHFRPVMDLRHGGQLLVLAAAANICYCTAYPVDLLLQQTPWAEAWRRRRGLLWGAGMALAAVFAFYWIADEIYPYVN